MYISPDRTEAERQEQRDTVVCRKLESKGKEKEEVIVQELKSRTVVAE